MTLDPRCYLLWSLLLLTVPLPWLLAAISAAAFHEVCHLAALRLCNQAFLRLHISPFGAFIQADSLSDSQELLCALAGPAGSMVLLIASHRFPRLALCGAAQGFFNLLPFYPLDGGRALRCGLRLLFPLHGDSLAEWMELLLLWSLLLTSAWFGSAFLLFLCICLLLKMLVRKKPCKQGAFRVQ